MGLGAFFWQIEAGASLETARTMVVNLLVFGEMVYLLNVRRILAPAWSGPGLWLNRVGVAALISIALVQVLFTHLPEAHGVFGSGSLGAAQWGIVLAAGAVLFTLVELEKHVLRAFRVAGRGKSGLDARRAPAP
jgi:magnesium-transporting ATPase (P-type)